MSFQATGGGKPSSGAATSSPTFFTHFHLSPSRGHQCCWHITGVASSLVWDHRDFGLPSFSTPFTEGNHTQGRCWRHESPWYQPSLATWSQFSKPGCYHHLLGPRATKTLCLHHLPQLTHAPATACGPRALFAQPMGCSGDIPEL